MSIFASFQPESPIPLSINYWRFAPRQTFEPTSATLES
jgi:hypothetical protein